MKTYDHTWLCEEWVRMGRPKVEYATEMKVLCTNAPDYTHLDWNDCEEGQEFNKRYQFRIKSKPWINWEHVSEEFNFLVCKEDAHGILSDNKLNIFFNTVKHAYHWARDHKTKVADVNAFASFTQGTCDWRDSLVMRPVVIGETK